MAWKRMALMVAVIALLAPSAAFADGVDFSLLGGTVVGAGTGLTNSGTSTLTTVSRIPKPPGPSDSGSLGAVSFTTGSFDAGLSTGAASVFDAGGSITVTSNGTALTNIGFSPSNLEKLFTGSFSGPTSATCLSGNWNTTCTAFNLSGAVTGTVDPGLLAALSLGNTNNGFLVVLTVNLTNTGWTISSGDIFVGVPEPGTLALFGTGLIALAGLVYRKIAA